MTVAILYGAGSGALHAVTGPDHVLSLGTVALTRPNASFRIGLSWGVGHALGTLLLALPLLLFSHLVYLPTLASWGDRLAGLALIGAAAWSWRSHAHSGGHGAPARQPLIVGLIHGVTGAGSLLLVMPVLLTGSLEHALLFLAAFAVGSTVAMAALTSLIAKLGSRLAPHVLSRARTFMTLAAAALGVYWLAV